MKRTTVRLEEPLLREVKKLAAETGRTLTQVIQDSLQATLARRVRRRDDERVRFTTCRGRGPLPGVDLDNTAALLDLMEGARDPR